jgi:hypothetical protein
MRLNFIRAALSLDLNNSTLAHDAVGPSTPTTYSILKPTYSIPRLPPDIDLETVPTLKAIAGSKSCFGRAERARRHHPHQGILIDTLALQEAKASSEIENIVTTQDKLFQADLFPEGPQSPAGGAE